MEFSIVNKDKVGLSPVSLDQSPNAAGVKELKSGYENF